MPGRPNRADHPTGRSHTRRVRRPGRRRCPPLGIHRRSPGRPRWSPSSSPPVQPTARGGVVSSHAPCLPPSGTGNSGDAVTRATSCRGGGALRSADATVEGSCYGWMNLSVRFNDITRVDTRAIVRPLTPLGGQPMKIVSVDPQARVLSEQEVLTLLREPIPMRLGMVDDKGWPLVMPVWHVYEDGVFRVAAGVSSHKANVLRKNQRAYFTVDTGGSHGDTRSVRGRANVRVIDGDVRLAVDVARKGLVKYTGTDSGSYADDMLKWARDGGMSVVELTPLRFGAFSYE